MREFEHVRYWGGYRFTLRHRKAGLMGRFGGGWNWVLGFQASGPTLILNLLVVSLRIDRLPGPPC